MVYKRFSLLSIFINCNEIYYANFKHKKYQPNNIRLAKQYKNHANCTKTGVINIFVLIDQ